MLVVGGGNAAVESAFALVDGGKCASVTISYRKNNFARCRQAQSKAHRSRDPGGPARRRSWVLRSKRSSRTRVTLRDALGEQSSIQNDAVVVQVGGTAPTALLQDVGIEIVTKYGEA